MGEMINTATLAEAVRAKVQAAVVDLIPNEAWLHLIQSEVDKFLKPTREYGREEPSGISRVVRGVLEDETKRRVADVLGRPEMTPVWDNNAELLPAAVTAELAKRAPEILVELLRVAMGNVYSNMRAQVR